MYLFSFVDVSGSTFQTSSSEGILETTVIYQGSPYQGTTFNNERGELLESLEQLILERNSFEMMIFDYLVEPVIPDDFWNPVVVCLSKEHLESLEELHINDTCFICTMDSNLFKKVHCCNKQLCNECTYKWFEISVKCPFCKQDLREVSI